MSNVSFIKILADLSVASHQHVLPPKDTWKAPQNDGQESKDNYVNGVEQAKWGMGFEVADGILTYFKTQDPHLYHMDTAATMTKAYKTFIHTMLDATQYAFGLWKPTLFFKDLKINGPCVIGKAGCLTATGDFVKFFQSYPGHASISGGKHFNKWRDAVAKGVDACLKEYIDNVTVPGLPWYPAFAAFPGPVAPPMPNVPTPLITCPSKGLTHITLPDKLKKAMLKEFDKGLKDKCNDKIHETVFEAIATALAPGFLIWVSTQTVNLVMGTGNIPSFAPPVVPVGPVVNGQNIPSGGGNLMP
ncbi:MAG: hypothetical protein J6S69_00900 [Proteobacteria bacterium]|jgi:hypothetical protein|nr:hypothetical protein [Pseudomonadota bacterium]